MKTRTLGKTGLEVSVLGFGGSEIGFKSAAQETTDRIVAEALEAGVNVFDTAAAYLESEKLLGTALRGKRKNAVVVTKCGAIDGFSRSDWSKAGILKTIETSLKNLQSDYVDILLLHSCGELEFLMGEALAGLKAAREKGYARYIGYSGDGSAALSAVQCGEFDVLETSINIADQEALELTLPLAREKNMGVIAKRPLANTAWTYARKPGNSYHVEYWQRLRKLDYPFLKGIGNEGVRSALGFTLSQEGVHTAIVGVSKPERVRENVEIAKLGNLPPREIQSIRARWNEVAETTWVGQI